MNKTNTKNIEETKRSHVESMELANKEIDELTDKIAGLSEEYELKRKELDAEIEPLNSLLELKEDKIVELINNDKVFLSKRISEKSVKKFLEPFQGWLNYNTRYGFHLFTDIPGNKSKIWWPTVEKILLDALKLDKKYQLKFKQQESELNDLKQRQENLDQREKELNELQLKINDQILKLGIIQEGK